MFEEAKRLIEDYHFREFGSNAKAELANLFHNIRRVPLGMTTAETSEEQTVEGFADLVNCGIDIYVDGKLAKSERYSPEDFLSVLGNLEFDELFALSDNELKTVDDIIANATERSKAGNKAGIGKQFEDFDREKG